MAVIKVRISNESLNSYGCRVLTAGLDITQYQRNPVLLFMHERGKVIGLVKNIVKSDGEVTGELEFDEASDESVQAKKQFEFGSLRMVSACVDIIETSNDPKMLVQGQTGPTVTKSKLCEVSVVDIGSNDDAIRLRKEGSTLELGKDLTIGTIKPKSNKDMDIKTLALSLGLPETASEADVMAKIKSIRQADDRVSALIKENDSLKLSSITRLVEDGVASQRIPADKKEQFIKLGSQIGADSLKETIDAMSPRQKLSAIIGKLNDGSHAEFKKLSDVPQEQIETMRKEDRATYVKLFKSEYGFTPDIDND